MNVSKSVVLSGEKWLNTLSYKGMNVQEIYNTTAVKEIEQEILTTYFEDEVKSAHDEKEVYTIRKMLEVRKTLLNDMFILDDDYKQLLYDFNEALIQQLKEMRKRTIALYQTTLDAQLPSDLEVEGKCFLGYGYSTLHPVQTMRAKKMWAILNRTLDNFNPLYEIDGAGSFRIESWNSSIESENHMLYGSYDDEEPDNFNEGLDREMTKDMHLIYSFHDLYEHMNFSIFDLLWVRDFNIELKVECDYNTYYSNDYCDNLNWRKCDFYD